MDVIIGGDTTFSENKVLAGIASAESRKKSISEEDAQEILETYMPVYNALAAHWSQKKVTSADCEKIKSIIDDGKTTMEQMIEAIVLTAEQTPPDKIQYMKAVSTWLDGGCYAARKNKSSVGKLDHLQNTAGSAALLAKMGGKSYG